RKEQWVIPPRQSGEFVARMEDVLEVYHRPYDERRPLVCLDEVAVQLVGESRVPLPARPGQPARYDYEYVRNGTANLFMVFEPLLGWRWVKVTERRTASDLAEVLRELVEEIHGEARKVVLVTDNLNTHSPGCLYEAFEPAQARRIAEKLEWHYTPRHGSWLNTAEVELAALGKQCLGRRIGSAEELRRQVAAWELERNEAQVEARWQSPTAKARVKLRRLYPSFQWWHSARTGVPGTAFASPSCASCAAFRLSSCRSAASSSFAARVSSALSRPSRMRRSLAASAMTGAMRSCSSRSYRSTGAMAS